MTGDRTHPFDAITVEQLRTAGGIKWSTHPDALGAFIAEMDFGVAPPITAALHHAVDRGLTGYLPTPLAEGMAEAFCTWTSAQHGWQVPPRNVRPLADVLSGLQATVEHFSSPGTPVILPTPAYMPFLDLVPALGRRLVEVPMAPGVDGGYVLDLDALAAAFAGGGVLVLCNPHNPTGRVMSRDELLGIAEVVDRHGGRVFSDEIHAPIVRADRHHVPYAALDEVTAAHTVTATSTSKAWNLPGLKCAQLVLSDDADVAHWDQVGVFAEKGASTLGVVAATAAYTAGAPWLEDVLAYVDGTSRLLDGLLEEQLPRIGHQPPEGTYLAWLDCRALDLAVPPAEFFLAQAGVALTDGASCGAAGEGFVRLTLATPRPILRQIVARMAEAVS